jgi:hypothetical protein
VTGPPAAFSAGVVAMVSFPGCAALEIVGFHMPEEEIVRLEEIIIDLEEWPKRHSRRKKVLIGVGTLMTIVMVGMVNLHEVGRTTFAHFMLKHVPLLMLYGTLMLGLKSFRKRVGFDDAAQRFKADLVHAIGEACCLALITVAYCDWVAPLIVDLPWAHRVGEFARIYMHAKVKH